MAEVKESFEPSSAKRNPVPRFASTHKFNLGQDLVFVPGAEFFVRTPVRCTVTRLLPKEGMNYQYYIRTELDGQQRRAWESQLRLVSGTP